MDRICSAGLSRTRFLEVLGVSGKASLLIAGDSRSNDTANRTFTAVAQPDVFAEHEWRRYPNELHDFTSFVDSLAAVAYLREPWAPQRPITNVRGVMVVDFKSATQAQAEASIDGRWTSGGYGLPMGAVNTVASRIAVDAQNDRVERHLSLIATAMHMDKFVSRVIRELYDSRSCPNCEGCATIPNRTLVDAMIILARKTKRYHIELFARWQPDERMRKALRRRSVNLAWYPLDVIPAEDLAVNRFFHVWHGTPLQDEEFRRKHWQPTWRQLT
ncbi:MAG TPA: hypothetical protein VME66_08045 [Candidatus Acidoferrales bacterium]|nr:hypothetical protein [Candidatus Acidoferrales bacterium]